MALSRALAVMVAAMAFAFGMAGGASAEDARAASRAPLTITVFISSRTDLCYDPGDAAAVRSLARQEVARINRRGGIAGRSVEVRFADDERDQARTVANLKAALADPSALAMIGLAHSGRAKAALDANGGELASSGIPLLSAISVNSVYEKHDGVFTMQASQDDERLPVMARFIQHMGYERLAFVGLKDTLFSEAIGDGLRARFGEGMMTVDHRIRASGADGLDTGEAGRIAASLKAKQSDMAVLAIGGGRAATLMQELIRTGTTPALFVTGRIDALPAEVTAAYPNAIYQLAWDQLPEAYNDRLRRQISRDTPDAWTFEGTKVATAPGWAKGECKERQATQGPPDPLEPANLRAIALGTQYADMIGLVAAATSSADGKADVAALRRLVTRQLKTTFAAGAGTFRGSFDNWSFNSDTRAAIRTPFVVMLPHGLGRTQLAPVQFVRVKDGSLKQIETLYVDIDMIKAHRIEDNEKTFFAEFYLAMRDTPTATIDAIDFTNAYLDPRTNGRQLSVQVLHNGGPSNSYPSQMKVYKVTGRFLFEPDLSSYPFDTQRFSIDLQPKKGDAPFIVQPPPRQYRDGQVATDGWDVRTQYVGYDEDFVPVTDAFTHKASVAPFYKASFVWLMKRQTTDYFLRVVVPLAFILIVAYLSIFIPATHFEAIVTIQVTALLSAVALYLSLPKLDSDTATISDRIFVFDYMMVSLMIGISVMRVNRRIAHRRWAIKLLGFAHVWLVPTMVAGMTWYVWGLSQLDH